jgi:hypothetical protein
MDRYNFRTTSLNNAQLTTELTKRGAKTFGSLERKQQRLQRFLDREETLAANRTTLQVVIQNQQRLVYERQQARAEELLRPRTRSQRIANALYECLIY